MAREVGRDHTGAVRRAGRVDDGVELCELGRGLLEDARLPRVEPLAQEPFCDAANETIRDAATRELRGAETAQVVLRHGQRVVVARHEHRGAGEPGVDGVEQPGEVRPEGREVRPVLGGCARVVRGRRCEQRGEALCEVDVVGPHRQRHECRRPCDARDLVGEHRRRATRDRCRTRAGPRQVLDVEVEVRGQQLGVRAGRADPETGGDRVAQRDQVR